jgi:hypothetical protein
MDDKKQKHSFKGPLIDLILRQAHWGKGGRRLELTTLPHSCAVVMKSGNFNFLEPSGPLQACNGTALPLLYKLIGFHTVNEGSE